MELSPGNEGFPQSLKQRRSLRLLGRGIVCAFLPPSHKPQEVMQQQREHTRADRKAIAEQVCADQRPQQRWDASVQSCRMRSDSWGSGIGCSRC